MSLYPVDTPNRLLNKKYHLVPQMNDDIRVWGYLREYAQEKEDIMRAVESVFQSGMLILGENVRAFEHEYASYCGVKYGIGCDNGTNAISLALHALGIGQGDEVITVSNTAIPTVSAIVSTGAKPVFVDIDPATYLMDVSKVEGAITHRTRAIIPVHLYGQCVDMDALNDIASHHNLFVIEDCAQAHGATYKGKKAGAISHISTTSFYPTKVLGAYGDGGMMLTNISEFDAKLRRLRFYGAEQTYYAIEHGYNSRLDEVQAAILRTKLQRIEQYIARRREIAQMYNQLLADTSLILPKEAEWGRHVYYLYVVRHPNRDQIIAKLKEKGIYLNISYPTPIHLMDAYKHIGKGEGSLPNTEVAAKEIFSLPMFPTLTNEEVERIVTAINSIL